LAVNVGCGWNWFSVVSNAAFGIVVCSIFWEAWVKPNEMLRIKEGCMWGDGPPVFASGPVVLQSSSERMACR
jgi:hypothetical protein